VKKSCLLATIVATLVFFNVVSREAAAQQPGVQGMPVAIVDLAYIFKNHARLQAAIADMRRDVDAADKELQGEKETFRKLAMQLDEYRKGTPEFKDLEEQLAKRQNDLQLKVSIQKKNFIEQEAKILFNAYQEIQTHIKYYSEANRIFIVLRFNGDPIDQTDPQEVNREIGRFVMYYNRAIDITPIILEKISAAAPPAGNIPPAAGIPGGPPQRTALPPRQPLR
jgi:Skp family chaperone for outer membrane proteins